MTRKVDQIIKLGYLRILELLDISLKLGGYWRLDGDTLSLTRRGHHIQMVWHHVRCVSASAMMMVRVWCHIGQWREVVVGWRGQVMLRRHLMPGRTIAPQIAHTFIGIVWIIVTMMVAVIARMM